MPGFDGSGPVGGGPMSGRGRGYCVLPLSEREGIPQSTGRRGLRRFGRPRFGLGFGRGRGRRRRWW
ncbi:MAG TPA: DUF5320 domain-containing protein [Firmicutes bacterium]|nr:DUF5320 domain-containing protein [Bacillota bacterium]